MFHSTMELFTLAASNSLLVFGLCNLIIVILLLSDSKPNSPSTQESYFCTHEVPKRIEKEEKGGHEAVYSENIEEASLSANVPQVENAEKSPVDQIIGNVDGEERDNEDEYEEDDYDDDDELRRRVEEFIDKINRGWKAEKSTILHLSKSPIF
ncbi:uncharacterized protein LOC122665350 [Telopea speciosissima]|uniref:uncharacterized protein LOC122665350 n=1 Tax=Telopea speciosissima TaxID=54955 RepID=UPI001CC592CC|nr:uncharacterized protein LOC122665350 [Telopea speciosissima]